MEDKIIQTHITILLYLMLIVYLKSFTINLGDMPKKLFTYIKVYYAFLIVITVVAFFRRLFLLTSLYITDTVNKLLNYVLLKDNKNEVNYVKSYTSKSSSVHDLFFQNNLESEILNKYLNESKIDFYKYFLLYDDLIGNDKNANFCLTNKNEVEQNEINYNQTQNNNFTPMEYKDPNQKIDNNFINNDTYLYTDEINETSFSNSDAFYDVTSSQTDRYTYSFNPINTKYTRKIYSFFFRKNNTLTKKTSNKGKEREAQEPDDGTTSLEENERDNKNEEDSEKNRECSEKNNEKNFQKKIGKGKSIHNRIKSLKLNEDAYFQKHLTKLKHLKFVTFMLDLLSNYKKYIMIDKIIKHLSRCASNTNHKTLSSSIKLNQNSTNYLHNPAHNNFNNINNEKENDELAIKNINNLEKTPEQVNNNCMRKNNKLENSNLFPSNIFGNMFNLDSEKKSQKPFFQNVNLQNDNNNNSSSSKDNTNVSTGDETKKTPVILKSILKKRNPSDLKNENNSKNKNQRHIRFNPKVQTLLFEKYSDDDEYIYNMNNGKKGLYKIFDDYNIKNSDIFSYYNMRNNLNSIFTDIINSVCVYKDNMSRKF
ncbi:conserved Plasmodium protein, unknown function [Plasmodium vinckei vinckei]|uniref:Uncharacterized protein n=1 Tax=Plasmodium vinckei vinckei TaxID=54757 RepID=A0A081IB00_PLAVN|nr:conserved Plasmodium protein, unknown function [Plasmodium vinckei vinckei]KEG00858.1 hypothetical protein YYE_04304 [Plasmodium vinckei vinckei]VEV55727.1 conserved Plasmodium protein, unknown function [Plasmodium vinckei vinckei]